MNWYRTMEMNMKWSSSRPNDKVRQQLMFLLTSATTINASDALVQIHQSQFSFCPPGASSCADGDGGPRPDPAAVSLRGDGEKGEFKTPSNVRCCWISECKPDALVLRSRI